MLIFKGHRSLIRELMFSPDGTALATTAGKGYAVSLWDSVNGSRRAFLSHQFHTPVTGAAFLPRVNQLISMDNWNGLYRWDLTSLATVKRPRTGIAAGNLCRMVVSPQGDCFYSVLQLWYANYLVFLQRVWIARGSPDMKSGRWQFDMPDQVRQGACTSLAMAPNHRFIAFALKVQNRHEVRKVNLSSMSTSDSLISAGQAVAFSPDSQWLAVAVKHRIEIRDTTTWDVQARFVGHQGKVNDLVFSPDGQKLLSGGEDQTVRMWDVASQCEEQHYNWEVGRIGRVTMSPDGMRAAAGGQGQIVIWDVD